MKRLNLTLRVLCAFLMLASQSWGAVIADYRADYLAPQFNGQTRAARQADGWDYKWNKFGAIGTAANYASMLAYGTQWNTDGLGGIPRPDPGAYDYLHGTGGHTGRGSSQTGGGNTLDRYAIAAYTVQAGEEGMAQLGNATIRVPSFNSNGVEVRVYVNDTLIGTSHVQPGGALPQSFGRVLGNLNVGDTVYVAIGPNTADGSDSFEVSFAIDNVVRDRYWQAPGGGAGTWDTSSNSWALDAGGTSPGPWVNADNLTAIFGGTAGIVSIGAADVTAMALVFNTGGYVVHSTGGKLALTSSGTSTAMPSSVRVANAGDTAEIAAQITAPTPGAGSLWKDGAGTLVLSNGANDYGTTTIAAGTLRLGASNAIPWINDNNRFNLTLQDATLDLNGYNNTLHRVSMTGGTIQTGAGTLSLTYRNSSFTSSAARTALITGNLEMVSPSSYFTFEVGDGPRAIDVQVDAKLTGALGSSFFKDGAGTMLLTSSTSDFTTPSIILRRGTLLIGANAPKNAPGALGNNNAVVQMGDSLSSTDRYLLTQAAVDIGHDVNVGAYAHVPVLGGNTAHTSAFSGNITLQRGVELTAVSGGRVNFTGNISGAGGVVVLGAGEVALSGTNSYTDLTAVRQGTLIVGANAPAGANGALGNATSAILLGDAVLPLTAVRVATTAGISGTFNPTGGANGKGQYTGAPTSIDGVTLAIGDRVLVKNETAANALRNGVYVVTASGTWDRATDFDDNAELLHGTQVAVTAGSTQAGRKYYLANLGSPVVNTTAIDWKQDPANPSVALLVGGAFTVGRDVTVTNNASTGTSTLGGNTADVSTFSGTVTLNRATLLTAATGGTVSFTGRITGAGAVTKTGAGTMVFGNAANDFTANPTISAGVLSVPDVSNSGQPGALGSGTGVVLGSATLQFTGAGADSTNRALTLTGTATIDVSHALGNLTWAGAVSGGQTLNKLGPGKLSLTGGGTYGYLNFAAGPASLGATGVTTTVSGGVQVGNAHTAGGGSATLDIVNGTLTAAWIQLGNAPSGTPITATINQSGGDVRTTGSVAENAGFRLGHYPDSTTYYNMSGGTLLIDSPYYFVCAVDGTGTFYQTGGEATAVRVVVNARAGAGGNGTFTVAGGTFNIGSGGIVNDGTGPAAVNLGGSGATIRATATWSSSLPMTLSGAGATAVTFDTNGNAITLSGVLSGAGGLNKTGAGSLILTGQETYTGPTTVSGGTLSVATGRLYSDLGWQNRQITVNNGGVLEVGGWADGDGRGAGQVAFAASNILIDGGTIRYVAATSAGNSDRGFTIGAGGATLEAAGSITWNLNQGRGFGIATPSGGLLTLAGAGNGAMSMVLGGAGGLTKTGSGTWTLTGANTYTGPTNVTGGTLALSGAGKLYSNSAWATRSVTVSGGAVLQLENWVGTGLGEFDYAAANLMLNDATLRYVGPTNANPDAGSGRAFTIGAGGATLDSANAATTWTINRYMVGANEVYPLASNGGLLTLTGAGSGVIDKVIPGAGALVKSGDGAWTLTRANTYAGGTTVTAGRLLVNNAPGASGVGTGDVLVQGGTLGGVGQIGTPADASNVTVQAGGRLAPGTTPGVLTIYGDVLLEPGSFFDVEIDGPLPGNGPGYYDQLVVHGAITLTDAVLNLAVTSQAAVGQSFTIIDNDGLDPVIGYFYDLPEGASLPAAPGSGASGLLITYRGNDGNDVLLTGVPEPATWLLLALGLAGLGAWGLRRRVRG